MFSKFDNSFPWFKKSTPPKRPPFTLNTRDFMLVLFAVIIGVVFQTFLRVIFGKIKKWFKFGFSNFHRNSARNTGDIHVSRKIATESYNTNVANAEKSIDLKNEGTNEGDVVDESVSRSQVRKLRSRASKNYARTK